jgi:hypothetical protein
LADTFFDDVVAVLFVFGSTFFSRVVTFLAGAFLVAAAFLGAVFLAGAFLVAAAFLGAVFLAGAFLVAAAFLGAAFLAGVLLTLVLGMCDVV